MTGTGQSSARLRAVLALGMVLGLGSVGTAARWTDNVAVTGTSFTSGTIDLQINDANAVTSATLSMADMSPGATSAEVFRVKNAGSCRSPTRSPAASAGPTPRPTPRRARCG